MELPEAFTRLKGLSCEQLRQVLLDLTAEEMLRGVAALLLARRRDLPVGEKVRWLSESWDSATLEVKKYILDALGDCPSPEAIAFVKERLSDPDLQVSSMASLAKLGETSILPLCERFIRSGAEIQCVRAIGALSKLGTTDARSLIEVALRSGPTERARQFAATMLASNGISSGGSPS
jgi:HEAT repeat protein